MNSFVLHSNRLLLDAPDAADIDDIFRFCQDPAFERYLTVPWPYHRSDADFFVSELVPNGWAEGEEFTWALRSEAGGRLLGVIGLRMPTSDVGFWLGATHRGNGYMPEALGVVADWALGDNGIPAPASAPSPGLDAIGWECVVGNAASVAVARKCGFTFTGVAPSRLPHRNGNHPESWHGELRADDDRQPKSGWPA